MKTYVLYHANCFDGSGAAYAAWVSLGDGPDIEYIPVQYGEEPPPIEAGSKVYILDFSYSREVLESLRLTVPDLVVLDHHKTAQEALQGFPGATFDMTKSGAVLAWEYFHPDEDVPLLLKYIQDRDLWKWELKDTKYVTAALPLYKDFRTWHDFAEDGHNMDDIQVAGCAKVEFDTLAIQSAVKNATVVNYGYYRENRDLKCALLNTTTLTSEIGNELCKTLPVDFSLTYFVHATGDVVFSFRSVGDFDVSVLAKALGGGGHRNASGARIGCVQGMSMLDLLYTSQFTPEYSKQCCDQQHD